MLAALTLNSPVSIGLSVLLIVTCTGDTSGLKPKPICTAELWKVLQSVWHWE